MKKLKYTLCLAASFHLVAASAQNTELPLFNAEPPVVNTKYCVEKKDVVEYPVDKPCPTRENDSLLDDLDIHANLNILSLDLLEAVKVGVKYKYEVKDSYQDEYFTRLDRWKLKANITPGSLLIDMPINISLKNESELVFAQQFSDGKEARKVSNGYLPNKIPLTAKKAKELKPGDYVRFNAEMSLGAGLGQTWPLAGDILEAKANLFALISGEYQVHVFRLDKEKVRVKLVGLRSRSHGFDFKLGADDDLKILNIELIDKQLLKLTDLDEYIKLRLSKSKDNLFMLDYTLDLSNKAVAEAYDDIFNSVKKLRLYEVADPRNSKSELKDKLIGNLQRVEALEMSCRQDVRDQCAPLVNSAGEPLVVRNFKGSNSSPSTLVSFKYGFKLVKKYFRSLYRKNFLTRVSAGDGKEQEEYFTFPTWKKEKERSLLFGKYKEDVTQGSNALFISDKEGGLTHFENIGFNFETEDSHYRAEEHAEFKEHLATLLPDSDYRELKEQMELAGWHENKERRKVNLRLDYFFHGKAFEVLNQRGLSDKTSLREKLIAYIVELDSKGIVPFLDRSLRETYGSQFSSRARTEEIIATIYGKRINFTVSRLAKAFNKTNNANARFDRFSGLRQSDFFRKIGPGFFVYLLKGANEDLSKLMYLNLSFRGHRLPHLNYQFGSNGHREFYEVAQFIDEVLNNRSEDMREWANIDSLLTKMKVIQN